MSVVKGQGHTIGPVSYQLASFSFNINQTNNSGDRAISKFDLETSKVKVMSEVKGQGHILYPVSNQCTSFSLHMTYDLQQAGRGVDMSWGKSPIFPVMQLSDLHHTWIMAVWRTKDTMGCGILELYVIVLSW